MLNEEPEVARCIALAAKEVLADVSAGCMNAVIFLDDTPISEFVREMGCDEGLESVRAAGCEP